MIETSAAYVAHAMATHSPDIAKNYSAELLPLIFLAMHAKPSPDEDSKYEDSTREEKISFLIVISY